MSAASLTLSPTSTVLSCLSDSRPIAGAPDAGDAVNLAASYRQVEPDDSDGLHDTAPRRDIPDDETDRTAAQVEVGHTYVGVRLTIRIGVTSCLSSGRTPRDVREFEDPQRCASLCALGRAG